MQFPASHKFFNSVRKKVFLVAPLTNFVPRQFLERIATADENWVHHYKPESKAQSVAWKCLTSPVSKKFKRQPSASKIMLTLFRDTKGAILFHFTPKGPDLATSNFHITGPMKEALRGRFSSDEEVIGAVQNWIKKQPKNFFLTELKKKLVKCCNRCVEVEGDYVEK
jgi:hypothetical protein